MALKYVYVFGEGWLPGYSPLYSYCHVPIDNMILEDAEFKAMKTFNEAWSRISEYKKYMAFQIAVRERFKGSSPLAVEFTRWQSQLHTSRVRSNEQGGMMPNDLIDPGSLPSGEDPDYSPETDHYSDPKAARDATIAGARKAGLSEEVIANLFPLENF